MRCFADLGLSPEDLQEIMSDAPFQADIGEMEMEPSITVGFSSLFFYFFLGCGFCVSKTTTRVSIV